MGDWWCKTCRCHVYGDKETCGKCVVAKKPGEAGLQVQYRGKPNEHNQRTLDAICGMVEVWNDCKRQIETGDLGVEAWQPDSVGSDWEISHVGLDRV